MTETLLKAALTAAGAALVASLVANGVQYVRLAGAQKDTANARAELAGERAQHAQQREAWAEGSRQAEAANRETERLRRLAMTRIEHDETERTARLERDAAGLRTVAGQLRDHVTRLAAAAPGAGEAAGDPAAAPGGPPAAGAGLVLAELYRGADLEAIELAEAVDRARGAGLACERAYGALTP